MSWGSGHSGSPRSIGLGDVAEARATTGQSATFGRTALHHPHACDRGDLLYAANRIPRPDFRFARKIAAATLTYTFASPFRGVRKVELQVPSAHMGVVNNIVIREVAFNSAAEAPFRLGQANFSSSPASLRHGAVGLTERHSCPPATQARPG